MKFDATAPVLAPVVTPASVPVGGTATATPNATDPSSGVASQSCEVPRTTTAGAASVLCQATDVAGNRATKPVAYTVVAATPAKCSGVADRTAQQPLNPDGSSVFLRSSGVPIIFRACTTAGTPITHEGPREDGDAGLEHGPAGDREAQRAVVPADRIVHLREGALKTWVGQIPTAALARRKKYTYRLDLSDGTSFTVTFGVR